MRRPPDTVAFVAKTHWAVGGVMLASIGVLHWITRDLPRIEVATRGYQVTGSLALLYLVNIGMRLFGFDGMGFIHESSLMGIAFSGFVVVIAALNLVLDFDFIEKGVEQGAPKHMEWYAAFGLLVTLIWLYLEMLRLLSKLQSRN